MRSRLARDVAVVVLVHLALASAVGLLLPFLVDLPAAVRTADGVTTTEIELGKQFNDDGWLIVLGGASELVLGVVLQAWRRTHEVVTLLTITVSAFLAALLAGWLAEATGPGDPVEALSGAMEGARASMPVSIDSRVAYLVWPLAAVVGALVALLAHPAEPRPAEGETEDTSEGTAAPSDASDPRVT